VIIVLARKVRKIVSKISTVFGGEIVEYWLIKEPTKKSYDVYRVLADEISLILRNVSLKEWREFRKIVKNEERKRRKEAEN